MATHDTAAKFSNLPSFLRAVRSAGHPANPQGPVDRRLNQIVAAAPSSYGAESTGADGGFLIPPGWAGPLSSVIAEESLAGRCLSRTTTGFSVNGWTDGQPSWSGSGIKPKRQAEGAAIQQAKSALESRSVPLHALKVLIPATEELFEDTSGGAELYFEQTFRDRVAWEVNRWLLAGSGVGEALGLLNAPATLVQTKESGQSNDTLVLKNFSNLLGKLHPPARSRSAWVFSPSAWAHVEGNLAGAAGSVVLDYSEGRPRLFGLPVFESDAMQVLGDAGDVLLFDPLSVLVATRGGPQFDASIGIWFDYGLRAFRCSVRIGIASLWSAAVSAYRGSGTYSNAVTLEAR